LPTVDVIASILKENGIDRIFGIPGSGATTDLIDAVSKRGIEVVLTSHESSAAMIASVYGEIKGPPGVCFSITGPGATNMASGVAYAYLERAPLIAISERHGAENYEFIATQKIDQASFFAPITKAHFTVTAKRAQDIMEKAVRLSTEERPGPVHLDLAKDEAVKSSDYLPERPKTAIHCSHTVSKNDETVRAAMEAIRKSSRPVLIAGMGAKRGDAHSELTALAEALNLPVMVTLKGRGAFDEAHPLFGGIFLGAFSEGTFEDAVIGKSDLLILSGVDPVEFLPKPWGTELPVIHIGFQTNAAAVYPADLEIVGDIKGILGALAETGGYKSEWDPAYFEALRKKVRKKLSESEDDLPLHHIIRTTREKTPLDGILCTDVGAYNSMAHYLWQVHRPDTYFVSKGLSTMGYALPAAIGAQLARPDKKVVCFIGDGSFLMCLPELAVCSRLKLPIVIVVFSDGALGLIKVKQKAAGTAPMGVQLGHPDFAMVVKAFGGEGFRVKTAGEFDHAIETAINSRRLTLIEAVLNPETYGDHMKLLRG
jgi:acetolactate synthase I/II/III large subunit